MKKAEYIQANFRIGPVAAAKLNEATEMASQSTGRAMIPALFWAEEYDEIKRKIVVLGLSMVGTTSTRFPRTCCRTSMV